MSCVTWSSAFSAVAGQRSFLRMWTRFWSVAYLFVCEVVAARWWRSAVVNIECGQVPVHQQHGFAFFFVAEDVASYLRLRLLVPRGFRVGGCAAAACAAIQ